MDDFIIINTIFGKAKVVKYNDSDCLDVFIGKDYHDFVGQLDIVWWYTFDDDISKAIERMIG